MTTARAVYVDRPVAYADASALQQTLVSARLADEIGDVVLFLQHLPVVTLGRSGKEAHLLRSRKEFGRLGIDVEDSTRGGDVTYHAPGQLVVYPILKLAGRDADVRGYVRRLEEAAIRTAAGFGIEAFRRERMTGVWTASGKIAAIGVRIRRWVTSHGMSLNVNIDLAGFDAIVPCGLSDRRVTSMDAILARRCPSIAAVRDELTGHCETVLGRRFRIEHVGNLAWFRSGVLPVTGKDGSPVAAIALSEVEGATAASRPRTPRRGVPTGMCNPSLNHAGNLSGSSLHNLDGPGVASQEVCPSN